MLIMLIILVHLCKPTLTKTNQNKQIRKQKTRNNKQTNKQFFFIIWNTVDEALNINRLTVWQFDNLTNKTIRQWQLKKGHWPVNDNFPRHHVAGCTFTKLSLTTGQWQFTSTPCGRVHLYKIVIDHWSMTLFQSHFKKCHWPVNDNF